MIAINPLVRTKNLQELVTFFDANLGKYQYATPDDTWKGEFIYPALAARLQRSFSLQKTRILSSKGSVALPSSRAEPIIRTAAVGRRT
jgi:hypothetical protein